MRSKLFLCFSLTLLFLSCRISVEQQRKLIHPIPFEQAKWDAQSYEDRVESRPGMARKLVNDKSLIGKNRIEIIDMLGEDENKNDSPNIISYTLIDFYGSIEPIAVESLKIALNSENKVEKAEIELYKTGDW